MGVMRFLINPQGESNRADMHRAYIVGIDGRVFATRVEVEDGILSCYRTTYESGKLCVPWPVEGFGRPVLTTASLMEREEPYLLPLELARGMIAEVRDQLGAWEGAGMSIPSGFRDLHREAHRLFTQATMSQATPGEAAAKAQQALTKACRAADMLVEAYARQRLAVRRSYGSTLPAALGCDLGPNPPSSGWAKLFGKAFTAATIPVRWRDVEPVEGEYHWEAFDAQVQWCDDQRLLMIGGPLLDLSPEGMPDWLWQWHDDFLNLLSFVCDFIETAISRYVGKVRHWEVSARANTGGALALDEEHRLALAARTLDAARKVDDEVQLMIRVDQPWGEYQARGQHRLSPLQFVDALLRSSIGLAGVNLEIAVGYEPSASGSRHPLEFSRLLDLWSLLGIPLHVTLVCPSASGRDRQCTADLEAEANHWKKPWSPQAQAEWINEYLPVLMAKDAVVGIHWAHFADSTPHRFPHGGLLDADGRPKPALERFSYYRGEYWK